MTNWVTRAGAGAGDTVGILSSRFILGLSVRVQPWQSPKGEINMARVGARKGHPTPPA